MQQPAQKIHNKYDLIDPQQTPNRAIKCRTQEITKPEEESSDSHKWQSHEQVPMHD